MTSLEIRTGLGLSVKAETLYHFRCWSPDRTRLYWEERFPNLVTAVGCEYLLRRGLLGQTLPAFNDGTLDGNHGRRYPDGRRTPRAWTTGTKAVGDVCQPTAPGANGRMFVCIVAGASAGSEPSWPTSAGASVTDGAVTWYEASALYIGLKASGAPASTDRMDSHPSWSEITAYSEAARQAWLPAAATSGSTNNAASVASYTFAAANTVFGGFMTDFATKGGTAGLLYGAGDMITAKDIPAGAILDVTCTASIAG